MRVRYYRPTVGGHGFYVDLGHMTAPGAANEDPAAALHAAAGLAKDFVKAIERQPELQALLPPQAQAALTALKVAAWAAKNKKLRAAAKELPRAVASVINVLRKVASQ
jgi:hypothetical protein